MAQRGADPPLPHSTQLSYPGMAHNAEAVPQRQDREHKVRKARVPYASRLLLVPDLGDLLSLDLLGGSTALHKSSPNGGKSFSRASRRRWVTKVTLLYCSLC